MKDCTAWVGALEPMQGLAGPVHHREAQQARKESSTLEMLGISVSAQPGSVYLTSATPNPCPGCGSGLADGSYGHYTNS